MYPLKILLRVGGSTAIALAVLSSTMAEARDYGHRIIYREYNNPDVYPTGSSGWWQEMDRQGRGGRK
jgi:hypothetical protein